MISANLFIKESSPFVRIRKAERLRYIFEEKAKHNGQLKLPNKGQKGFQPISAQNFALIGRVSKEIGKIANVSYRTVEKAKKIERLGSQKQIEDLINDKKSIHQVSLEIKSEQEKKKLLQEAIKINSKLTLPFDQIMLYYGDIRDPNIQTRIPDEVADVSITDPPYEEKYLSLYEDLPSIVYKKLKPGAISFLYMGIKLRIDMRIVLKPRD